MIIELAVALIMVVLFTRLAGKMRFNAAQKVDYGICLKHFWSFYETTLSVQLSTVIMRITVTIMSMDMMLTDTILMDITPHGHGAHAVAIHRRESDKFCQFFGRSFSSFCFATYSVSCHGSAHQPVHLL